MNLEVNCDDHSRSTNMQQLILARLRLDIEDPLGLSFILGSCDHLLQYMASDRSPCSVEVNEQKVEQSKSPASVLVDIASLSYHRKVNVPSDCPDDGSVWSVNGGSKSWSASDLLSLRLHYDRQAEQQSTNNFAEMMPGSSDPNINEGTLQLRLAALVHETAMTLVAIKREALRIVDRQLIRASLAFVTPLHIHFFFGLKLKSRRFP